jgi:stringent starvation protein B
MCPQPELPPKKAVAEALLEGPSMLVHLDPRRAGVVVPPHFKKQPQLVLQMGLNLVIPIKDLAVDHEGISGTLSFNRSPFWCNVPWLAVYALVGEDGRGMVWPEDVPPELAAQAERAPSDRAARKRKSKSAAREPTRPRVLKRPEPSPAPELPEEPSPPSALAIGAQARGPADRPPSEDEPAWAAGSEPVTSSPAAPGKPHKAQRKKLPPYLRVIK